MHHIISHFVTLLSITLALLFTSPARAQLNGEGKELASQLKTALEQYNKGIESEDSSSGLGTFFIKRNLVTDSLKAALKRGGSFEADPFICAQDVVPGFFTKKVQMREDVARVEVGIKQYSEEDPPMMVVYVLVKESDGWKIDDIDYSETKMNGESLGMSTLKEALR